jgi:hypothetical protein
MDEARQLFSLYEWMDGLPDVQSRSAYLCAAAAMHLVEGRYAEALEAAELSYAVREFGGITQQDVKKAFRHAVEAALALGDRQKADELISGVEAVPVGLKSGHLEATARRLRGRWKGADPSAGEDFAAAVTLLRKLEMPFELAVAELELGEWLAGQDHPADAEPFLTSAAATFEHLETPALAERAAAALAGAGTSQAVA